MGATTTRMTVEEFLNLPEVEGERLELIDGEVNSMPLSGQPHEVTKSNLIMLLAPWATLNPGLRVFCEAAFQVNEANCLIPDISLISSSRIVPGGRGIFQTAPEFAIEVVSSEPAARLEDKIELYLSHGSKSVWVVYPNKRTVRVFDIEGGAKLFGNDQPLTDPSVLPGFSIPTSAIFEGV
ncbi:MAG: Uma2 family endonuclease [Bryobacteraceae bacterium]|jgi:Uma2 family endonuclease